MALGDIADGSAAFIDANILIYHFAGQSEECSSFLARVERREVHGFSGAVAILEVAHRLMSIEAAEHVAPGANPAARLGRHPDVVRRLSRYYFSVDAITRAGVEVLALPSDYMAASQEFRQAHGLLVNDSLVPMHMRRAGLSILVSADEAFDRIPGIRRFGPEDL